MIDFKEEQNYELRKFLSGPIQNEVLTINSEHPYSVDHFESKFQANISPSEKSIVTPKEELIDFKEEHHDGLIKFSLVLIHNEVLALTSEHLYYADHFERIFQANISPYKQSLENQKKN